LLNLSFSPAANSRRDRLTFVRHVLAYDGDGVPSVYGSQRDGGELWLEVPDVAIFHLPVASAVLTAIAADSVDSDAVLDAYYGTALPLVLQATRGLEVLHGSAVLVPTQDSVVAFSGLSGSGKSTVAYGLVGRGYSQWADDAVAFRVDDADCVTAVGLPFTVKLREGASAYFDSVGVGGSSEGRAAVVEDFESRRVRLGAVFVLQPLDQGRPGEGETKVERLAPPDALRGLLPNAFQDRFQPQAHERRRETLSAYLELVASVPVLSARWPRDFGRLPELLDEIERWLAEVP
jgi:hypothetical protein